MATIIIPTSCAADAFYPVAEQATEPFLLDTFPSIIDAFAAGPTRVPHPTKTGWVVFQTRVGRLKALGVPEDKVENDLDTTDVVEDEGEVSKETKIPWQVKAVPETKDVPKAPVKPGRYVPPHRQPFKRVMDRD